MSHSYRHFKWFPYIPKYVCVFVYRGVCVCVCVYVCVCVSVCGLTRDFMSSKGSYSKYGCWTDSIEITWEIGRNAEP